MQQNEIYVTIEFDMRLKIAGLWPYIVTPGRVFVKNGDKIYFSSKNVDATVRFPRSGLLFTEKHDEFEVTKTGNLNAFTISPKEPAGTVFTYSVICKHTIDGKEIEQVAEGCSSPQMIIEE
jgi:hypothetical protein